MLENSRTIVDPAFANSIAKAYGQTLKSLGIMAVRAEAYHTNIYNPKAMSVSIYEVAKELCFKVTGIDVHSGMHGKGSYAEDITEKAIAELVKHEAQDKAIFHSPKGIVKMIQEA